MKNATVLSLGLIGVVATVAGLGSAQAQDKLTLWNTTTVTITKFQFAAPGTTNWGSNQCDNDPDHSVSADERLRLKDVKPGRYDVKLADSTGRTCIVHNVDVKVGGKYALEIGNNDLKDCVK